MASKVGIASAEPWGVWEGVRHLRCQALRILRLKASHSSGCENNLSGVWDVRFSPPSLHRETESAPTI